ncbi:MAG: amidohydrolase family protein, partial [Candidatus Thermoplasmatota archaeon]|nr:amidohydrolase family protein [Candidatus Thermoplasmatota archaeon]
MVAGTEPEEVSFWSRVLFVNGLIWDSRELRFRKGELLLSEGRIENISFSTGIPTSERSGARSFDLQGGLLSPAFIDAHMHLLQWSISNSGVDLSECLSREEMVAKISRVVEGRERNSLFDRTGIFFGTNYDDSRFNNGPLHNGNFLEKEFKGTPVILRRVCGHRALLNSDGVERMGLSCGSVHENTVSEVHAMELPWRLPLDVPIIEDLLKGSIERSYSLGVVGGVEILPSSQIERMNEAYSNAGPTFRIIISMIRDSDRVQVRGPAPASWDQQPLTGTKGCPDLPVIFEKFFLDGSIGARTASFSVGFSDSPPFPLVHDDPTLRELMEKSYVQGFIPMVHCIGDRAISQAIHVLKSYRLPHRLEHAESIDPTHLKEMKDGKGALCMQPNFQHVWGRKDGLYERALGAFSKDLNPFGGIIGSGIPMCFGTDMMPPGPLYAFKGGIDHPNPAQRLSATEMIKGFTLNSARLSFLSGRYCGGLVVGSEPDMIAIDRQFNEV